MPMDLNKQKEQFSIAYIYAVTAAAGYNLYEFKVDDSSIDVGIKGYPEAGMTYEPRLDLQLKCTADDGYLKAPTIAFDLDQKNYNDLCSTLTIVPHILVVVIVPEDQGQWLTQTEHDLRLKYCGYWHSLAGQPPIHQTQKRIHLNRTNVFNVTQLQQIMRTIGMTGRL